MKNLKKTFLFALLAVVAVLGSVLVGVWLGQDRIIALFVQEANRHLRTPVRIGKLEVSVLNDFPRVAVTLHEVVVAGSLPRDTAAMARLRTLHCAFNAWDLVAGRYRIRQLTLEGGYIRLRLDAQGRPNYAVFRVDSAQTAEKPLAFDLETIRLTQIGMEYADASRQHRYSWQVKELRAALTATGQHMSAQATGQLRTEAIQLGADRYFRGKEVTLTTQLEIDYTRQQLTVKPSAVSIDKATYRVSGSLGYGHHPGVNMTFEGQQTDLQAITALLPARLTRRLGRYQSRGQVYFRGAVRSAVPGTNPHVEVQFGCRDASFYHPDYHESVEHVYLTGTFSNGSGRRAATAALVLQNVRGTLRGRRFSGSLRYENLLDPTVRLDLRADLDMARVLRFAPVAAVRQASGQAQLVLHVAGNLRQFKARPATARVQAAGELTLRGVSLQLRDYTPPLTGLTGSFLLRGDDIAVTNFTGRMGRSDFRLNGFFKNALGWQLLPHQQLLVEADVESRVLDLDELLRARAPKAGQPTSGAGSYALEISPNLALDLQAQVQHVRFRRFRGQHLRGTVRLQQQVLSTPGLSVEAGGGSATLRGTLNAQQPNLLQARTHMTCAQLPLDSLFYVGENFGQSFLTSRHLRGTLTATAEADLYFDGHLQPLTDRLEAEIKATVRNGELNNFMPLQKLSMVASREQLRHLRFAQLTNSIYIQSRTVYVPEMEIRSNVRTASVLRVRGTHTFDQQIDYHLSIPLLPGLLHRPRFDGEAVTGPAILLAVQGTEDNFRVSLEQRRTEGRPPVAQAPGPAGAPTAGPRATEAAKPVVPAKLFEVKKPVKKPAQPQPDTYFDF